MRKKKFNSKWDLIHYPNLNLSASGTIETIENSLQNTGFYFNKFSVIMQSLFDWTLPDTMDAQFLEWCLFWNGRACGVKNIADDWVNLQYTDLSEPNIYNLPTKINAFSNHFNKDYKKGEYALCRNDINYTPGFLTVKYFTDKIAEIEKTIQMNIFSQRVSTVFSGSKDTQLSMLNAFNKFNAGMPYMFVAEDFNNQVKLTSFRSDTPYICDKLYQLKRDYFTEFFEFIGINVASEKQERLIVDEVNANNQFISINFNTMLKEREKFCKDLNALAGAEIASVKPAITSEILNEDKGGAFYGTLYGDTGNDNQ